MKTNLFVIENDEDYAAANDLVVGLMASDAPADRARMVAQARLIEDYEKVKYPSRPVPVADILAYVMDQHSLTRADLVDVLGSPSRVSDVLNGKRALSMTQVQKIRQKYHVPADLLIPPAEAASGKREVWQSFKGKTRSGPSKPAPSVRHMGSSLPDAYFVGFNEVMDLYVKRREAGGFEVRREGAKRVVDVFNTQKEAINGARALNPKARVHVERVRATDIGHRDKWRKV